MSKLYIFGIGGTGSRVLNSLTMLLAAGVDCGVDTIVPIIIDRDESNGDYSKTKLLIENYKEVNKIALKTGKNKFFKTKIELINNELLLKLKDNTEKFEDFIGKQMSGENKALVNMLFSKETLNLDMTAGFQGNPNIGSVVLNQFDNNDIFTAFAASFKQGDKIFIISSIFGGTGASGFPLLRKVLHTKNQKDIKGNVLTNWGLINEAPIGAISVLPYFIVNNSTDGGLVNSDTFIDKTKAALSYYKTEDKKLDTLYYIADKQTSSYEHHKGGDEQRNDAHFVELISAMAILDFVNPDKFNKNIQRDTNNQITQTTYKEFGVLKNDLDVNFNKLADETNNLIMNPLSRFALFCRYMGYLVVEKEKDGKKIKTVEIANSVFDKQIKYQPYARKWNKSIKIKELDAIQSSFYRWLLEMANQTRMFSPFNLETKNAFSFVRGSSNIISNPSFLNKGYSNWARMDNELNKQISYIDKSLTNEQQFMELFYCVTESLINSTKN